MCTQNAILIGRTSVVPSLGATQMSPTCTKLAKNLSQRFDHGRRKSNNSWNIGPMGIKPEQDL
jgi:hypothetical protein